MSFEELIKFGSIAIPLIIICIVGVIILVKLLIKKVPISSNYSITEHFAKLGRPWRETDKSKKRIRRSDLRKRNL